jgi:hypothetical protein
VRGQATWPGILACMRTGPRRFAGKAELTGRSHGLARAVERTSGRADKRGPRDSERSCTRGGDRCRLVGPTGQQEGEGRARACADAGSRWQVGSTYQATRARAAWLGQIGPGGLN